MQPREEHGALLGFPRPLDGRLPIGTEETDLFLSQTEMIRARSA